MPTASTWASNRSFSSSANAAPSAHLIAPLTPVTLIPLMEAVPPAAVYRASAPFIPRPLSPIFLCRIVPANHVVARKMFESTNERLRAKFHRPRTAQPSRSQHQPQKGLSPDTSPSPAGRRRVSGRPASAFASHVRRISNTFGTTETDSSPENEGMSPTELPSPIPSQLLQQPQQHALPEVHKRVSVDGVPDSPLPTPAPNSIGLSPPTPSAGKHPTATIPPADALPPSLSSVSAASINKGVLRGANPFPSSGSTVSFGPDTGRNQANSLTPGIPPSSSQNQLTIPNLLSLSPSVISNSSMLTTSRSSVVFHEDTGTVGPILPVDLSAVTGGPPEAGGTGDNDTSTMEADGSSVLSLATSGQQQSPPQQNPRVLVEIPSMAPVQSPFVMNQNRRIANAMNALHHCQISAADMSITSRLSASDIEARKAAKLNQLIGSTLQDIDGLLTQYHEQSAQDPTGSPPGSPMRVGSASFKRGAGGGWKSAASIDGDEDEDQAQVNGATLLRDDMPFMRKSTRFGERIARKLDLLRNNAAERKELVDRVARYHQEIKDRQLARNFIEYNRLHAKEGGKQKSELDAEAQKRTAHQQQVQERKLSLETKRMERLLRLSLMRGSAEE